MSNAPFAVQSIARLPQPLAGAMCCMGAVGPWGMPMAMIYELAYRQAVEAQQASRFFKRLEPSLN